MGGRCYWAGARPMPFDVVIALGTNMGNRGLNLHLGLRRLRELGVQVLRHSALYETAAAYVTDQPSFLNAAVLARTSFPPGDLLRVLKQVEAEVGRDLQGGPRFGPRPLDLDLVFYGAGSYRDERLEVPHPRWQERDFVCGPVSDLLYKRDTAGGGADYTHPGVKAPSNNSSNSSSNGNHINRSWISDDDERNRGSEDEVVGGCSQPLPAGEPGSVIDQLREVRKVWWESLRRGADGTGSKCDSGGGGGGVAGGEIMRRVTPLLNLVPAESNEGGSGGRGGGGGGGGGGDALLSWGRRTHVMGILNVTPDSFSDGGRYSGTVAAAVAAAEAMVAEGAVMIDVGGQSTRPGATRLSPREELSRVMPVLRALRGSPALRSVPLSVDTFYAEVAREAVEEGGANLVNDVSGGAADPAMLPTIAALGVPYILMHMRGDPITMTRPEHTVYGNDGVWRTVGAELQRSAEAAEAAGVAAWNIILDPGIGFAKTVEGNLELLRNLGALRREVLDGPYGSAGPCNGGDGSGGGRGFAGPMLVGPSRKRFLGTITGRQDPAERDAATAAACVVCVAGGADVVRVHAVGEVRDALKVADAVYRGG